MIDTIFIMPNKKKDPTATMMIVVNEKEPSTDPKTYQYVYVGNINDLPSDILTESSIVDIPGTDSDSVMSQKGATDLVSEYNVSTNNNNTEYTFAQAVALVPSSLQKGGLTIKYVDSTTHEYTIRRLKSSTWNTTENNWESVETEIDNLNEIKANKDGYYSQMTVGSAENLVGQTVDSEAYLIRPTGGENNEVANGAASVIGMEGNSCVWNQLVDTNTTSVTLISGRKYYTKINNTADIVTGAGNAVTVTGGTDMVIDLTLLNIDNLTALADVEAWMEQHVGTKPHYAYNSGTILSAQTLGVKTYEQNLLNPTTRQARLIPYRWEENSNIYTIKNVPSDATATFTPDATGVAESITITNNEFDITNYGSGILEFSTATADTYVCMKWDGGKDDDVVPFEEHTQDFDVRKVYGKVNGAGEYVQCFPNGMRSAGDVHDTLTASEAVIKIGSRAYQSGDESDSTVITDRTNTLYALSTPITYTDLVYRDGGIDTPLDDILFNITVNNWSIEEQLLTPYEDGNPTAIPAKISTNYSMDAVEEIDTIKHTYVSAYTEQNFSDSQKAQARRNIGAVEADGTYLNMSVGSAKDLAGENAVEAEYTYRQSGDTTGTGTGVVNITTVKGKSLVWNQLVNGAFVNTEHWTASGITASVNDNVLTFAKSTSGLGYLVADTVIITGHKYYYSALINQPEGFTLGIGFFDSSYTHYGRVYPDVYNSYNRVSSVYIGNSSYMFGIRANNTSVGTALCRDVVFIDLTQMFGAGNEPSTVAEFEALYPLSYYSYNAGTLINNNASAIETTGFNQWDGVITDSGKYLDASGDVKTSAGGDIGITDYIKVLSNTNYYFKAIMTQTATTASICWYDNDKNFISSVTGGSNINNQVITSPSNAAFLRCSVRISTQNEACINISDPNKNGTYESYEKHTFYFDKILQSSGSLSTLTGNLNGEGDSVVVFPDGMRSADSVYDEIKGNVAIKRIGSVDLGTLDWSYNSSAGTMYATSPTDLKNAPSTTVKANILCAKYETDSYATIYSGQKGISMTGQSNRYVVVYDGAYTSPSGFKAAMSGVTLYYELATPETYILDQTVTGGYQVNANGTERRLPEDTASSVNAPINYSVIYPINAVGTIIKLPINYISEKSLTNFTTELASKLGTFLSATIGISATYNQTTQEYDYSITITANE